MRIARHITQAGESPFAGISFKTVDIDICASDPERRVCLTDIEVPAHWSRAAAETFVRYYVRRTGVPVATTPVREEGVPVWLWRSVPDTAALMALPTNARTTHETSAKQVFLRMAGMWTYWGWRGGYFSSEADASAFHGEVCALLARQVMGPNSPQWFNAGLHWAYGMTGPAQGHFYAEFEDGRLRRSVNAYERPQLSACFIHGVRDELVNEGGIMDLFEREVRAFKYGSGSGVNMSSIRGAGEHLSSGGKTSGLKKFLAVGDKAAAAIHSGGLPRRAGKMVVVDIDHPDVLSFIRWKGEEQYKAAALMTGARVMRKYLSAMMAAIESGEGEERFLPQRNPALKEAITHARRALIPAAAIERVIAYAKQGYRELHIPIYSAENDSEIFFTVSAHQSRQAVRVTNRFMQAAEDNHRFALRRRTDGTVSAQEEAAGMLEELAHAVWAAGEPTIHFADPIADANPCPEAGPVRASTPSSEYFFLDDTACPLACINLLALADAKGALDLDLFAHTVRISTVMLDISVGIAQYPSREMARRTHDTRPLGLGFANFAPLAMRAGLAYDSSTARALAGAISALLTGEAQSISAELARERGAFAEFDASRIAYIKLITKKRETLSSLEGFAPDALFTAAQRSLEAAQIKTELYGARNAQLTAIPPTSTIARIMDCETLGLLPVATLVRQQMGGEGDVRKTLSNNVLYGLKNLGYSPEQMTAIETHILGHGTLEGSAHISPAALRAQGFGSEQLTAIDTALATATDIHAAFDPWNLGERFCRETLKLTDAQLHDASFRLLTHLGYSAEEIATANRYACGAQEITHAPHIAPEHANVFLSMMRQDSREFGIGPHAQIALMAAVQPFLSGGIAHTVLLAHSTTTETCRELILEAWHAGLKSLSLYRDGCALYEDNGMVEEETIEAAPIVFRESRASAPASLQEVAAELARRWMDARRELPQRRNGFTQKTSIGGHTLYLRTGEYEDGSLGEITLDMPDEYAAYRMLVQEFGRAISLSLQHGVPLAAFVDAFKGGSFVPSGRIEGSHILEEASSVLDYVFRELEASYAKPSAAAVDMAALDSAREATNVITLSKLVG